MNNTLSKILIFTAGAALGTAVTWKVTKTFYERIAQEEIDSVKEVYKNRYAENDEPTDEAPDEYYETESTEEDENMEQYEELIHSEEYASSSRVKYEKEEVRDVELPYVIKPEEFGECDYVTQSFTRYTDGVVTNERGKIVKNTDELLGEDFASHFGEYEEDSVFVRNDKAKIDFEILQDWRAFSELD
jgi:hypothetical protein